MSTVVSRGTHADRAGGLALALAAARARRGLIAALFGLAALAWWSTAERMGAMDDGPGTDLGALGWFLGVWIVMMAAIMFPSVSSTVALYARMTRRKGSVAPFVFAAGYLATWTAASLLAYGAFALGRSLRCTRLGRGRDAGSPVARLSSPPRTSSHRSRTSAWRSAAARSGSS